MTTVVDLPRRHYYYSTTMMTMLGVNNDGHCHHHHHHQTKKSKDSNHYHHFRRRHHDCSQTKSRIKNNVTIMEGIVKLKVIMGMFHHHQCRHYFHHFIHCQLMIEMDEGYHHHHLSHHHLDQYHHQQQHLIFHPKLRECCPYVNYSTDRHSQLYPPPPPQQQCHRRICQQNWQQVGMIHPWLIILL